MAIHAMIDLETLDVTPGAAVLTVGGVKFDPFSDAEPHSEFYYKLDLDSQDRSVNDSTIAWWGQQDQKVQDEAFGTEGRENVDVFLDSLPKWMVGVDVLWGHGYGEGKRSFGECKRCLHRRTGPASSGCHGRAER